MSLQALSDYTIVSRYSRYNKEKKRRETWNEMIDRVFDMHATKYVDALKNEEFRQEFEFAKEMVKKKRVLGAQRILQFGGEPIFKHNAKVFNCFSKETEFITSHGVKKFSDYKHGDEVKVLTHKGQWRYGTVKNYGVQPLNEIVINRGKAVHKVYATANHRWLLNDDQETTNLKVGDSLLASKNIFNFNYDAADPLEKLYWCYGLVFGDGTKIQKNGEYKYSMVRLCGKDKQYESRFLEMGFESSSPISCKGDVICYTGKYLKTAPNPEVDSVELVRAFCAGYLAADGAKNSNPEKTTPFTSIQSSEQDHIDFIRRCFPMVGLYIVSETELTGQETNYGVRPYTISFKINNSLGREDKYRSKFNVIEINPTERIEDVWCLEVYEDNSFVLPFGVTTGNCSYGYIDRPAAFNEAMYLLLCGCGVGFSVQTKHIGKLPDIQPRTKGKKVFVAEDSIEGWADCIAAIMSSYFVGGGVLAEYEGYEVEFDLSNIRPEGSLIANQFKAPGPKGLESSLDKIKSLIEARLANGENRLRSIDAYDSIMHFSDAVLSGGVRRSATICLFSKDDEEMMKAKTGDWYIKNPQRGRSNNSVLLVKDKVSHDEFKEIMKSTRAFGEPGFVFSESEDIGYNPCQNASAPILTKKGIATFGDLKEGDEIWSETGWTRVIKKWSNGIKKVYKYTTSAGIFYGTDKHRIVSGGEKIQVGQAETIDVLSGPFSSEVILSEQDIMDGLVLGDGTVHDVNNKKVLLHIGEDDGDYFSSEISDFIIKRYYPDEDTTAYIVNTTITKDELGKTYDRAIPDRFFYGDRNKVCGFLRGLYSANGSICDNRVTFKTASPKIREGVQHMLSSVGIRSYFTTNKERSVKFANGDYICKESYDINITVDKIKFFKIIGFIQKYKTEKLEKLIEKSGKSKKPAKTTFEIKSVEFLSEEEVFDITVDNEPHTYWTGGLNVSNCVEIGLYPQTKDGRSGWQFCNLTEGNGKFCDTEEKFFEVCRASAIIGTMQAGYTQFKYLGKETQEITEQEALLGCSITGIMDNPQILLNPEIQRKGAEIVKSVNKKISALIGINQAARTTCVKPAGSTSCVLSSSSGIHPHHARRYIRRVQANRNEFPVQHFKKINPLAVEKSVWSTSGTDEVISFLCEVPKGAITKNNLRAVDLLDKVKLTQQNWVEAGTDQNLCSVPYVRHNVSNTITIKDNEWDEVTEYIYNNKEWFAGISLLAASGDLDYPQAPFTSVLDEKELVAEYGPGAILASGLIVDGLSVFDNNLWAACDTLNGIGEKLEDMSEPEEKQKPSRKNYKTEKEYSSALAKYAIELNAFFRDKGRYRVWELKKDWVRRADQFTERYFDGDKRKMTHCLKHCYTLKQWIDLKREYKEVDWSKAIEETEDYVSADTLGAQACAGGSCELR
jgi:hypothetical protein